MIEATQFRPLWKAVAHLAWSPEEQLSYLTNLGVAPLLDELALEFDDIYRPIVADLIPRSHDVALVDALRAVDAALSSDALRWNFENIDDPGWQAVRSTARLVLQIVDGYLEC